MQRVKFEDYKKAYDRFWDNDKRTTLDDIELMINLINERTVRRDIVPEPSLKWILNEKTV